MCQYFTLLFKKYSVLCFQISEYFRLVIMRSLDHTFLASLTRCFAATPEAKPVHEHTALCFHGSFEHDIPSWKDIGYDVLLEVPGVAIFLASEETNFRPEIINPEREEHEAWAVQEQSEYTSLELTLDGDSDFEATGEKYELEHLWAKLYKHTSSGAVIQIVWRKEQIYPDLFD